jgi:hypothetical protein
VIATTTVLPIIPLWVIFKKAGFSGALALTVLFWPALLVVLYVVAFSELLAEQALATAKAGSDTSAG